MNPYQFHSDDEANIVEFSENPGRRLRVQRQSRGLEIERIAAQLHLRPAIIETLEQDHYEDLPDPVFVTGYIRNYARLLGLDPDPLIAAYRAANPDAEAATPRISSAPASEIGSGHILVRLISLALLVGVVAMLVLWWQDRGASLDGLLDVATSESSVALGSTEDTTAAESSSGDSTLALGGSKPAPTLPLPSVGTESEPPAPPVLEAPVADLGSPLDLRLPRPASTPTDTLETTAVAPATEGPTRDADTAEADDSAIPESGPPEVALDFSGPCWVNVKDAQGKVVLSGEMGKGDHRVLGGTPPYDFVIGNARATTLTVGGEPLDLDSRAKGNVARFELDPGDGR